MEDTTNEEGSPPPKLKRQERIPILKIEKLKDRHQNMSSISAPVQPSVASGSASPNVVERDSLASPEIASPPQLESFVDRCDDEEESDSQESNADRFTVGRVGRRMNVSDSDDGDQRECDEDDWKSSSTSDKPSYSASESDKTVGDLSEKSNQEKKRKSYDNAPRKIIQSIFAKPKVQKVRKGRKGKKGKATATKKGKAAASKPPARTYLNIKFPPTLSQRLAARAIPAPIVEEDDDDEESQESLSQEKDDDNDVEVEDIFSQESRRRDENQKLSDDEDYDDDDVEERSENRNDYMEEDDFSEVEIKEEPDDYEFNEDKTSDEGEFQSQNIKDEDIDNFSRKSDDEDDEMYQECRQEEDWKPVRAAMVAAMELVAKKQVTDDMRTERRIRKPNIKPPPPKGRGRRTIFKRAAKPTRGCVQSEMPQTVPNVFLPGNIFFQQGDIVCLLADLKKDDSDLTDNIDVNDDNSNTSKDAHKPIRFFQLRGILLSSRLGDCGSIVYLTPRPGCEDESLESFDPQNYHPDIFGTGERMVLLKYLHPVMHCPLDFYHGHDLHYNKPRPGYAYLRLGDPLIEWVSTETTEKDKCKDESLENSIIKEEIKQEQEESTSEMNDSLQ